MNQAQVRRNGLWPVLVTCIISVLSISGVSRGDTVLGRPVSDSESIPLSPRGSGGRAGRASAPGQPITATALALGLTAAGIFLALKLSRRFFPGLVPDRATGAVRVLSHTPLGNRGSVYVLHCGQRVLIVGASSNQLCTLAEIVEPEEVEELVRPTAGRGTQRPDRPAAPPSRPASGKELKGQIDSMLENLEGWNATS